MCVDPATPFGTIQLMDNDWKLEIIGRGLSVMKVDGMVVYQCTSLFITAFCLYFTFNIAYSPHQKEHCQHCGSAASYFTSDD